MLLDDFTGKTMADTGSGTGKSSFAFAEYAARVSRKAYL